MSKLKSLLPQTEASSSSVWTAWYDISGDHIHVYAAQWVKKGSEQDVEKANQYIKQHAGGLGLVLKMPADEKDPKKKAIDAVTRMAKGAHPDKKIAEATVQQMELKK